jgi:hypothetical protein
MANYKPAGPLGSGARFKALVASGKSPALAAWIGRRKHGRAKMAALSAAGRKRAAARRKAS